MSRGSFLIGATAFMLAATLTASLLGSIRKPATPHETLDQIPMRIGDWIGGPGPAPTARELELLGATSYLSRTYQKPGASLDLSISYYAVQRAGESMHTPKNCLPGGGWEITNYDSAEIPLDGHLHRINKFTVQNGEAKLLVLYWYQTRRRVIDDEYKGKAFMIWDSITKGSTEGSVVKIYLPDRPGAVDDALGFATLVMSDMRDVLGT